MSWEISLISKNISYQFQDKEFQTQQIFHEGREIIDEKSGGYKEPDDTVMMDISVHDNFPNQRFSAAR